MSTPKSFPAITVQGTSEVGKTPGGRQGAVVAISGTFNGSTVTLAYKDPVTGTITAYSSADASITAPGEIAVTSGENVQLFLIVTVADPTSIVPFTSYF